MITEILKCIHNGFNCIELEYIRDFGERINVPQDIIGVIIDWRISIVINDIYIAYEQYIRDIIDVYFKPCMTIYVKNNCINSPEFERITRREYEHTNGQKCFYYSINGGIFNMSTPPGLNTIMYDDIWAIVINLIIDSRPRVIHEVGRVWMRFDQW